MGQDDAARSDVDSPEARVGASIRGKWRIDRLLGVGGMACVYEATHANGRKAALKILHPELARDAGVRDRFLREGQIGNKIPHPARVEVLDHDTTDAGEPFLVMELLNGETLDQLWKRNDRKIPVALALGFAEQLLDFLSALHGVGIVHRDLKPANVFVCEADAGEKIGRVKVLDYGIAQLREGNQEHTRAGTALGTPSYMSPEQARGLGDKLDGRADIFSVGAMLQALITGQRLHQGRSNDEALILAATQPAPSIARIDATLPPTVIALVDKALQWDRRNRYENAAAMREAVIGALDDIDRPSIVLRAGVESYEAAMPGAVTGVPSTRISTPPDEPTLVRLRAWFKSLERLLAIVRQYGWTHPETERRLRQIFEETLAIQAECADGVRFTVHPYSLSFGVGASDAWEPTAPFDGVPYMLFESGLRQVRIALGVTEPELRAFFELLVLDPARDIAPEDDLATMLWELGLPHVHTESIDAFVDGDAEQREQFYAQSDPLEKLATHAARAARAEARAMAVSTERAALGGGNDPVASTLGIDRTHLLALGAQLNVPTARWMERYVDALADAYVESKRAGDVRSMLEALHMSIADLVATKHPRTATSLHAGLMDVLSSRAPPTELEAMRAEATTAMFGGDTLRALLANLAAAPRATPERTTMVEEASPMFDHLAASEMSRVIDALVAAYAPASTSAAASGVEELRAPMLKYVDRCLDGNAQLVAGRLPECGPDLSREILAILGRRQTADAATALADVAASSDLALRVAAIAQRADTPEKLRQELGALAEHARLDVRIAALRAIATHHVRDLGPTIVRRIEDATFDGIPLEERRALLDVLFALNAARAESIAVAILSQRAVLRSEGREQSRLVAAKMLADLGRTKSALDALNEMAKGWWGSSSDLRTLATEGARAVAARIEEAGRTGTSGGGR
jgi:serine/threonine protein kinase